MKYAKKTAVDWSGDIGKQVSKIADGATALAGGAVLGGYAALGRGTIGNLATKASESGWLKDQASKKGPTGFIMRRALNTTRDVAKSTFDTRNTTLIGGALKEVGLKQNKVESKGYKKDYEEQAKKDKEFAKSLISTDSDKKILTLLEAEEKRIEKLLDIKNGKATNENVVDAKTGKTLTIEDYNEAKRAKEFEKSKIDTIDTSRKNNFASVVEKGRGMDFVLGGTSRFVKNVTGWTKANEDALTKQEIDLKNETEEYRRQKAVLSKTAEETGSALKNFNTELEQLKKRKATGDTSITQVDIDKAQKNVDSAKIKNDTAKNKIKDLDKNIAENNSELMKVSIEKKDNRRKPAVKYNLSTADAIRAGKFDDKSPKDKIFDELKKVQKEEDEKHKKDEHKDEHKEEHKEEKKPESKPVPSGGGGGHAPAAGGDHH